MNYREHVIKESSVPALRKGARSRRASYNVRLVRGQTWLLLAQYFYTVGNDKSKDKALARAQAFIDRRLERLARAIEEDRRRLRAYLLHPN